MKEFRETFLSDMHLHFDLVGGISGDMFIAAMLDCFPEFANHLETQIDLAGFPNLVSLKYENYNDGVLTGCRFKVSEISPGTNADQEHHHEHHHRHYREIRSILKDSDLDEETRDTALAIFHIIAEAEAQIHNKNIEDIAFHEVGAWDSIADIVCASYLIAKAGITSISLSTLPLGSGQIKTAHGMLPIPAPATALILQGFMFNDDGIAGERITPTGAAILKYLNPLQKLDSSALILERQGFGFGTKKFPGISNVLRILKFKLNLEEAQENLQQDQVVQLAFEIDDQTAEELAAALDHIRALPGIIDIVQYAVMAKKNRLSTSVRILCQPNHAKQLTRDCFQLTTTLGIRKSMQERTILHRRESSVKLSDKHYRVKIAERPGGATIKAEMADLSSAKSVAESKLLRQHLESSASPDNNSKGKQGDK